jgi:hypothetical protein
MVTEVQTESRARFEHCMFCGAVVSQKTPLGALYSAEHVHFYYSTTFEGVRMLSTGILCLDHLVDATDQTVCEQLRAATRAILPSGKPVNNNFSASALKAVAPQGYTILQTYVQQFGDLIDGIVTLEQS